MSNAIKAMEPIVSKTVINEQNIYIEQLEWLPTDGYSPENGPYHEEFLVINAKGEMFKANYILLDPADFYLAYITGEEGCLRWDETKEPLMLDEVIYLPQRDNPFLWVRCKEPDDDGIVYILKDPPKWFLKTGMPVGPCTGMEE